MRQKVQLGPEYQVSFATAAKEAAGEKLLVGAIGGLASGKVVRDILESNRADVIFVGRQFRKNPGQVWTMHGGRGRCPVTSRKPDRMGLCRSIYPSTGKSVVYLEAPACMSKVVPVS